MEVKENSIIRYAGQIAQYGLEDGTEISIREEKGSDGDNLYFRWVDSYSGDCGEWNIDEGIVRAQAIQHAEENDNA